MNRELKPCPFCKGPASEESRADREMYGDQYAVGCNPCNYHLPWRMTVEEAIADWNRSTPRPSTDTLVEALSPFAVEWSDENGWTNNACQNDRVVDWFGPSDFLRARQALTAHSAGEVVGPKVKALIWDVVPETNKDWHDAVTPFVTYRMRFIKKLPSGFAWAVGIISPFYDFPNLYDDMSAAKAAAQRDYENRILSSLTEGK